ncbi:MAG: aspartate-semialdehyde dehydrogenase, partial [Chloroflexota bacterium]|nr:aspartate-semialdehyde dehydrogenase [Chloroflexota bacterium]
MTAWPRVGVAGARGVVGGAFLDILASAGLPAESVCCFGTEPGRVAFDGTDVPVVPADPHSLRGLDVLFLATDAARSREIVASLDGSGPVVVDNSSAFRLDPAVPLVVPEANADALAARPRLIANPNCTTAALAVALAPIRDGWGLESVDAASYQAVSGAGRAGLDAFEVERAAGGTERADDSPFAGRIADSVVPQIDVLDDDGWTGEENKIRAELRKILALPDLDVAATAVRVPVAVGHSVAVHLRTQRPAALTEIEHALRGARGVEYRSADGRDGHPMPLDVAGRDPVVIGRLRAIPGRDCGFAFFLSSDNLR